MSGGLAIRLPRGYGSRDRAGVLDMRVLHGQRAGIEPYLPNLDVPLNALGQCDGRLDGQLHRPVSRILGVVE